MGLYAGFWGISAISMLLCVGCGSDGNAQPAWLGQAPHCPEQSVLRIEGSVGSTTISDTRLANGNAGLTNVGEPEFKTPFFESVPVEDDQVALHIVWGTSLLYGQAAPLTGGSLSLPAASPAATKDLCLSGGEVGFVSGGTEDGVFKFAITEAYTGGPAGWPSCTAPPPAGATVVAVDVRGCFQ